MLFEYSEQQPGQVNPQLLQQQQYAYGQEEDDESSSYYYSEYVSNWSEVFCKSFCWIAVWIVIASCFGVIFSNVGTLEDDVGIGL